MRQEHRTDETMFVDYPEPTMPVVDREIWETQFARKQVSGQRASALGL